MMRSVRPSRSATASMADRSVDRRWWDGAGGGADGRRPLEGRLFVSMSTTVAAWRLLTAPPRPPRAARALSPASPRRRPRGRPPPGEVVFHADAAAAKLGTAPELRGAAAVAALFRGRAQAATVVLIDGTIGVRVAPAGRLLLVLRPTIVDGRIVAIEAVADRDGLTDLIIDELPA